MHFLNIHTHQALTVTNEVAIGNRHDHFDSPKDRLMSCGLHPWYLDERTVEVEWTKLQSVAISNEVVAIGECGLDKVCKTDWEMQVHWFEQQVVLANAIQKPLIIHCVRAYDEVLQVLTKTKNKMPVIFHGFNKKESRAKQLVDQGFYLSFGAHLEKKEIQQIVKVIRTDRFFLENDQSDLSIAHVYSLAAKAKGCRVEKIIEQTWVNARTVLGETTALWKI